MRRMYLIMLGCAGYLALWRDAVGALLLDTIETMLFRNR